jgi:hypothetical protein
VHYFGCNSHAVLSEAVLCLLCHFNAMLCLQQGDGPATADQQLPRTFKEQLTHTVASLWPTSLFKRIKGSSSVRREEPSFASSVASQVRATSARWLAQWAEDAEAREALLAFGSDYLLDFLVTTATEDPSLQQAHAEQALINFLEGYHTSSRSANPCGIFEPSACMKISS